MKFNKVSNIVLEDLDILSKRIAIILKRSELRDHLRNTVKSYQTKENILDAKAFLESELFINDIATNFKEQLLNNANNLLRDRLSVLFSKLNNGEIDIYFPIHEHLEKFCKNNSQIKVGFLNPEREWEPIKAYDMNGNSFMLDAHVTPTEPILMVNFCEHSGNHEITPDMTVIDDPGSGGGGGGGGGSTHQPRKDGDQMILQYVRQTHCEEPWGSGDPEIYYQIKAQNSYNKEHQSLPDKWDCDYTWYGELFHDYKWKTINKKDAQWWYSEYGKFMVYHFYERDGGNNEVKISFSVTYESTTTKFDFTIGTYDDDMQCEFVNNKDAYRPQSNPYDTGKIQFIPDWETIQ